MDEATQQNTQPVNHLRTKGARSVLQTLDEADILCFLHPASLPAHKAVDLVLKSTPQHVHISNGNSHGPVSGLRANDNMEFEDSDSAESEPGIPDIRVISPDIALRMSSQVRDRRMGFVFGRNLNKCDLLMTKHSIRLSSAHFRIYVNHGGVLMLEDMSTNGTYVDHNLLKSLKADPPNHGFPSTRMLSQGSIIELPVIAEKNEEWIRFIVSFPTRKNGEEIYQSNLVDYIEWIRQDERKVQIAKAAGVPLPTDRPMPFTPLQKTVRAQSPQTSTITATTGQNNFGMKWNGGETYNVVGHIGQGAFAIVFRLSTVEDGSVYACKQIEKRRFVKDGQSGRKMHDEIRIMESISHPNIVQFVDYHETTQYMFIIMEYIPLGDLTVYTNESTMMYEHMGQHVAAQICHALKYLHEQKIAHRDIKPDNILVASHNPFVFKLSDFGLSKIVSSEDNMRTFCGTILYCAPEIYPGYERAKAGMPVGKRGRHIEHPREETQPYYFSVDTWGIAAVLFHLLSGKPAWVGNTHDNGAVMLASIFADPIDWSRMKLAGVSDLAIDFLSKMLQTDPVRRATDEEIIAHPWIKNLILGNPAETIEEVNGGISTIQYDEDLPDASQLEISDELDSHGFDGTDERELDETLSQEDGDQGEYDYVRVRSEDRIGYPRRPGMSPLATRDPRARRYTITRLFGEIPESALKSSGFLGQNVHEALDIQDLDMKKDEDPQQGDDMEDLDMNYKSDEVYEQSSGSRYYSPGLPNKVAAAGSAGLLAKEADNGQSCPGALEGDFSGPDKTSAISDSHNVVADGNTENSTYGNHPPQALNTLHDSRFFDTEDLSKDLNMVSTRSTRRGSPAYASKAASSESIAGGSKSAIRKSKRGSQHLQAATDVASIKRSKLDYEAASELQPDDLALKENQVTHASHLLSDKQTADAGLPLADGSNAEEVTQDDDDEEKSPSDVERERYLKAINEPSSFEMSEVSKTVTHGYRIRTDPDELYLEISKRNKWKKAHPELVQPGRAEFLAEMNKPRYMGYLTPIKAHSGPDLNTHVDPVANLHPYAQETDIVLGILTPIEGSIPTVPNITITNRKTTFGRDPRKNTFIHPGDPNTANWERVGKECFAITFWYRNIEKEIDDNTLPDDWYLNPKLLCLISTRTSRYILINGTPLIKGKMHWLFGKLRTGDIITVVDPDRKREPANESETMSLSFRCEFFVGDAKAPRPEDGSDPFKIYWEHEAYDMNEDRIAWGYMRGIRLFNRAKQIAEGRDPDAEAAERAAKRRVVREAKNAKDAAEHETWRAGLRAKGHIFSDEEEEEEKKKKKEKEAEKNAAV